jgi:hypothetical protein
MLNVVVVIVIIFIVVVDLLQLFYVVLQRQSLLAADLEELLIVRLAHRLQRLAMLALQAHLKRGQFD